MEQKPKFRFEINDSTVDRMSQNLILKGLRGVSKEGVTLTKQVLSTPGAGELRRNGTPASKPGDPPAPLTGELRDSTDGEVIRKGRRWVARISVNKDYALPLELGTEKIKPRPFLSVVLSKYKNRLMQAFKLNARD